VSELFTAPDRPLVIYHFMFGKKQTKPARCVLPGSTASTGSLTTWRTGRQASTISVPTRDRDGTLRHFYSVHPWLAGDIRERGIDEYNPIWNVLELTPQGRGNWSASLDYGTAVQVPRRSTVG
jgi:predicted dithiol-disulfide oxidoreductase (DUF899 family)